MGGVGFWNRKKLLVCQGLYFIYFTWRLLSRFTPNILGHCHATKLELSQTGIEDGSPLILCVLTFSWLGVLDAHLSCFGVIMRAPGLVLIIALTDPCLPFSTIFKNDRKGFLFGKREYSPGLTLHLAGPLPAPQDFKSLVNTAAVLDLISGGISANQRETLRGDIEAAVAEFARSEGQVSGLSGKNPRIAVILSFKRNILI